MQMFLIMLVDKQTINRCDYNTPTLPFRGTVEKYDTKPVVTDMLKAERLLLMFRVYFLLN